ncbi:MAG: hypothetical protein M3429_09745 [Verrucomicrobiota bacterium]|jgi:DNA-directed RNA polymerase subunit RPC12/RpoP|nr:hypothetical protein [Verrucomicrobiota bacterium]
MGYKAPTLMFVCDRCGARKSLDKTKRHWCEECRSGSVEMRCTRDRRADLLPDSTTSQVGLRH